jgi:hypothetical protein
MYTKAKIYNLALGALLLQRQVSDPETDKSNEAKVLNTHYDVAFRSTLEDLDLDSTSTSITLELLETDPNTDWRYAYKYPVNCAFLRRIKSVALMDNRTTRIPLRVAIHNSLKTIFTNEASAVAECIVHDLPLTALSATVGLAIAYRLAVLSAPLIVGKGATTLRDSINQKYIVTKAEAQEQDRRENFNFTDDTVGSEFVEERLS